MGRKTSDEGLKPGEHALARPDGLLREVLEEDELFASAEALVLTQHLPQQWSRIFLEMLGHMAYSSSVVHLLQRDAMSWRVFAIFRGLQQALLQPDAFEDELAHLERLTRDIAAKAGRPVPPDHQKSEVRVDRERLLHHAQWSWESNVLGKPPTRERAAYFEEEVRAYGSPSWAIRRAVADYKEWQPAYASMPRERRVACDMILHGWLLPAGFPVIDAIESWNVDALARRILTVINRYESGKTIDLDQIVLAYAEFMKRGSSKNFLSLFRKDRAAPRSWPPASESGAQ